MVGACKEKEREREGGEEGRRRREFEKARRDKIRREKIFGKTSSDIKIKKRVVGGGGEGNGREE